MANSHIQLEVEKWVRQDWMPNNYEIKFRRERLRLFPGGLFDFDAVSEDDKIVANISTSSGITAGVKNPAGKAQKLRTDMLFLTMAQAQKKLIVLTERDMFDLSQREKHHGREPSEINSLIIELPPTLASLLK
jgi:hypothetical protein